VKEPSRLPKLKRDIAIVVPETLPSVEVTSILEEVFKDTLEDYELFDLYKGPNIPEGTVNLAFSLNLRAKDRTLTQEEVEEKIELLKNKLADIGGRLREW